MSGGTTGGQYAAPIWHSFMSVVHTDMNIPNIPGIEPHPVQVAEQQRIAAIKAESGAAAQETPDAPKTSSSLMSDGTRNALKGVAQALRKAAGVSEPAPATTPLPGEPVPPPGQAPAVPPERRAQTTTPPAAVGTVRRAVP
jgi:penicillin-binding protein 1A